MKKIIALAILCGGLWAFAPDASAASASPPNAPEATRMFEANALAHKALQVRVRYRTVYRRIGRGYYRETYRITRYRNGRIVRVLVNRVRVR